jgi:hypothetical protein
LANRNFSNSRIYTGHTYPVQVDCNFTVASADTGGLGITGLKGRYVQNVFMHTSSTAGAGNKNPASQLAVTNPNPAAGTIILQLQDNYHKVIGATFSISSPPGTALKVDLSDAALTIGVAYAITIVGDATAADWLALGVPAGVVPAVGVVFIAKAVGVGVASVSRVAPSAAAGSGNLALEIVGDPNASIAPNIQLQGFGAQIVLQSRNASGTSGASAIAAIADGSKVQITLLLSNSAGSTGTSS